MAWSNLPFLFSVAPVKADVFDHVTRRLQGRGFQVFAWLPTLSGQWLTREHPEDVVAAYEIKGKGWYRRATPFSQRVQEQLRTMIRELALRTPIDGILFQVLRVDGRRIYTLFAAPIACALPADDAPAA